MALTAAACLALAGATSAWAAPAPAQARHATAPPVRPDTTPLPKAVYDAGLGSKTTTATTTPAGSGSSASGAIARMLGGLAIVLAVIYAVYWLLKTYGKSKRAESKDERLTVLGTTTLAPNRALHLVRIGNEVLLVGSAESGVTPIRAYDPEALRRLGIELDDGDDGTGTRGGSPTGLADALRRWTAR